MFSIQSLFSTTLQTSLNFSVSFIPAKDFCQDKKIFTQIVHDGCTFQPMDSSWTSFDRKRITREPSRTNVINHRSQSSVQSRWLSIVLHSFNFSRGINCGFYKTDSYFNVGWKFPLLKNDFEKLSARVQG